MSSISADRMAFSLMIEENLSAEDALRAVNQDGITLPVGAVVSSEDLLKWAAIGLAVLNNEPVEIAIAAQA